MNLELHSMALEMPRLSRRHPNRLPFRGVLTTLDAPSDKAPAGARGRRVVLTRGAAEAALPSLLGMALDYTPALDGHDAQRKVGIITSADIRQPTQNETGHAPSPTKSTVVEVAGYVYARDFPDVVQRMRAGGRRLLGMSYEVAEAQVRDVRASVWELTDVVFTGAAILLRDKAAYRNTWIELGTHD
jgi:hypothetical protein